MLLPHAAAQRLSAAAAADSAALAKLLLRLTPLSMLLGLLPLHLNVTHHLHRRCHIKIAPTADVLIPSPQGSRSQKCS